MQTSLNHGMTTALFLLGMASLPLSSARAEDIEVTPTSPARGSTVRQAKKPTPAPTYRARAAAPARPTVPRPIQDETTPAANAVTTTTTTTSTTSSAPATPRPVYRPAASRSQEQSVNLDALPASRPAAAPAAAAPAAAGSSTSTARYGGMSPHGASTTGILPNFKFYYDFMLRSWKGHNAATNAGAESDFGFDSYHQRLMVEFTPTPDLMFQADLLQQQYFESDYMLTPRLQARWGRIWIPFDDLSPHSMFGGRINTSEFRQGSESAFLPDIWADLGLGLKYTLADSPGYSSELHFYIVNGFQQLANGSPVQGEGQGTVSTHAPYPNFSGTVGAAGDNNNAKAMGARWHSVFGRRFGLGVSVYKDTYTDQIATTNLGILIVGVDAQLRPTTTTEIRAGYVTMNVSLDPTLSSKNSYQRQGTYIELGQRFGMEDRWKFLLRAGSSQNDNRVVDVSDKSIIGATILKNFGTVETQVNFYHDLHQVASKIAYNYGEFRIVTAF